MKTVLRYVMTGFLVVLGTVVPAETSFAQRVEACHWPEARAFDFWIGDWTIQQQILSQDGTWLRFDAKTSVSSTLDGCAIIEHWQGTVQFFWEGMNAPEPMSGLSVRAYDPDTGRWYISWMDTRVPRFGGPYEAQPENLERLIHNLEVAGLCVDRGAAIEALDSAGQFNAIDPTSGWKADLIVRKTREFSMAEFQRRRREELFGIEVGLTTLEDLIIAKLEWSQLGESELQRRDIRNLLELAGDSVDEAYMIRWIDALGLREAWERVKGDV